MNDHLSSLRTLTGILLMALIFIAVAVVAPWLLIVLVPCLLYLAGKRNSRLQEADRLLADELRGKTREEIERLRLALTDTVNNPYATQIEKDNARYALRYIEKHFYQNK